MEKIKDFLHDYSDVFLAFCIVFAMVAVIYVNLTSLFHDPGVAAVQPGRLQIDTDEIDPAPDNEIIIDLESSEEPEDEYTPREERDDAPETEPPSPPPETGATVTVTIPNGTPGIGIAQILVDKQLLSSTGDFVRAAEDLDLALKLKSGTFQIPMGASAEEMVLIIARQ